MEPHDIDVVILCGGQGQRLRSAVSGIPKGMVEFSGKPFLKILIDAVARYGFKRFILCTGYLGGQIQSYFRNQKGIVFSHEEKPLGTAGGLKNCEAKLKSQTFLVLNGDSICLLDYGELIRFHYQKGGLVTVAVAPNGGRMDAGGVGLNHACQVTSFYEKRRDDSNGMNTGVYVFKKTFLDKIPANRKGSLEHDIFPRLGRDEFYAFVTRENVYDIGTPARLENFRLVADKLNLMHKKEGG